MLRRVEAIDTELRQLFTRVLHRHARAVYRRVLVERDRRDMLNIRVEVYLGPERGAERFSAETRIPFPEHLGVEWRRAKSQTAGRVSYDAEVLWSETVENHLMERELFRFREVVDQARRFGAPREQITQLEAAYQERRNTYIRNHHVRQRPPETYYVDGPIGPPPGERYTYRGYDIAYDLTEQQLLAPETATAVSARIRQQQAAYERRYLQAQVGQQASENTLRQQQVMEFVAAMGVADNPIMQGHINNMLGLRFAELFGDFTPDTGAAEAHTRALQLLKENLTPAQLAQYEKDKHFDVKGGTTGKTYRINHGRQQNIHELDAKGAPCTGWCFLPAGNLVDGDVMLAQKNALELFELDALRIANPFPVRGGRWGYHGPITSWGPIISWDTGA